MTDTYNNIEDFLRLPIWNQGTPKSDDQQFDVSDEILEKRIMEVSMLVANTVAGKITEELKTML